MIENLKNINDRNIKLSKFTAKDLEALYLRVFQGADGELVMQDLANRFHVFTPTTREYDEGQRSVWLHIQTQLQGAVLPKETE